MKLTRQQILKFLVPSFRSYLELQKLMQSTPAVTFANNKLVFHSLEKNAYTVDQYFDKIYCFKNKNKILFGLRASNNWDIEFELDGEWLRKNKTYNLEDLLLEKTK